MNIFVQKANETTELIKAQVPKATGRTAKAVRYELYENGFAIYAPSHLQTLITGRKPTSNTGGGDLLENIKEWIKAKGLTLNAYAVTKKIHKFGVKVPNKYNDGKILERAITPAFIAELQNSYFEKTLKEISIGFKELKI